MDLWFYLGESFLGFSITLVLLFLAFNVQLNEKFIVEDTTELKGLRSNQGVIGLAFAFLILGFVFIIEVEAAWSGITSLTVLNGLGTGLSFVHVFKSIVLFSSLVCCFLV